MHHSAHQGAKSVTDAGGFKHIKVTPAEEQEVVIHAGAAPEQVVEKEERTAGTASEEAPQPATAQPSKKPAQAYQGTTLDDIESSKMPKTQVAIIVVAVCAIIAFAVWYAFFS